MATPNTGIPYVPENTTDPAAGLNLALNVIDALLQTAVIDMDLTAPPGSPSDGDLHIVGATATGDWAGEDNNLARYVAEGDFWQFYEAGSQVRLILNLADGGLYRWGESDGWEIVGGLPDAPIDGTPYVRQDGDWVPESGGGGSVSSVNGDTGAVIVATPICVACSDETTALTTGTAKATFRMPYAMTLTGVRASVTTAPTGAVLTVDINESGSTILSTKITIDAGEKTSTTAATPPVISDTSLADDAEMTIDIDTVGSTVAGAGLKVWLIGYAS